MIGKVLLSLALALALPAGQSLVRPEVPDNLKAPASEDLILVAHATGVQIYACTKNPQGEYRWELSGPRAELFDAEGKSIGKHYADTLGPAWEHRDGSKVIGKKVTAHSVPNAILWLLLTGVQNSGSGALGRVKTIQRLHTKDGLAPESGCDEAHAGREKQSAYSADYYFYAPPR
jgi:Protein of unknown function (DUF3455)